MIKVISNESIPAFETTVNTLLKEGYVILNCGAHETAFWAIMEKK